MLWFHFDGTTVSFSCENATEQVNKNMFNMRKCFFIVNPQGLLSGQLKISRL